MMSDIKMKNEIVDKSISVNAINAADLLRCSQDASAFSADSNDRTRRVFGSAAFERIQNSRVCLLGLGGVGSYCLSSLVRSGVGNVLIIDGDAYDVTNINRQEFAFLSTVGKRKVDVAKAFVAEVNPRCTVETHDEFILSDNIGATLDVIKNFQPDWIVDAIDAISIKLLLAENFVRDCELPQVDYVSAMGAANKLDPSRIQISCLSQTCNDGLCRVMRKEARKRHIPDFTVCYSDEQLMLQPEQAITREVDKKILGSVSFIPSIMGITIAGHVIRSIAQNPNAQE